MSGPGRAYDDRAVPLHRVRGDHARLVCEKRWQFSAEVCPVGGAEGEWLRRELATVVRDLLVWARDDIAIADGVDPGPVDEERAA